MTMRAILPYHFCAAPGCDHMTPPGVLYCPTHALGALEDDHFFPDAEQLQSAGLSADASQRTTEPMPTTGAVEPGSNNCPTQ